MEDGREGERGMKRREEGNVACYSCIKMRNVLYSCFVGEVEIRKLCILSHACYFSFSLLFVEMNPFTRLFLCVR